MKLRAYNPPYSPDCTKHIAFIEGCDIAFNVQPEIADEIVRRVNAHERLRITLGLVTETIEAVRPLLSLDTSPRGAELVRLLDVVIGESKAVLALAEKGEGTRNQTPILLFAGLKLKRLS